MQNSVLHVRIGHFIYLNFVSLTKVAPDENAYDTSSPIYTTEKILSRALKSGLNQIFLTIYTGKNQVRLMIEKILKAS